MTAASDPADLERARRIAVHLEQELATVRATVAGHIAAAHILGGPASPTATALQEALEIEGIDLTGEIAAWHFPKWKDDGQ